MYQIKKNPPMRKFAFTFLIFFVFLADCLEAQSVVGYRYLQDSLSRLSSEIWKQKTDSARLQASEVLFHKFQKILEASEPETMPFDSVQGISQVASINGKLRIFTWNVPLSDGTSRYYGFLQLVTDDLVIIPLRSIAYQKDDFTSRQFTPHGWYGALYYKLIENEINGQKTYTLLGWDGLTGSSNRKIIDVLTIGMEGKVQFGLPVFKTARGIQNRVEIEYAENSNFLLRYDYQVVKIQKKKKVKKVPAWLIVMDRLVPMDPSMQGMQKYYVPSGDTYDAFWFKDGFWVFVEDIEVANNPVKPR